MRKTRLPENPVEQGKIVAIRRRRFALRGLTLMGSSILAVGCLDSEKSSPTEPETPGKLLAATASGFKTAKPPYLVPLEPGVTVDPILSTGDIVGSYQMSGIPDGLGSYKTGGTIQLFMNHELDRTFPAPPFNNGSDARVSHLTLNPRTHGVIQGSYPLTGNENFTRFCSSTLEKLGGTYWYLTGEETISSGHFGSSIALNAETGLWVETPHFGKMQHENVVPLEGLSRAVLITTDDDFNTNVPSYLYAYIANSKKFEDAIANDGDLYVWRADDPAATPAAMLDGQSIDGHFVAVSDAAAIASPATLKAESASKNAARFIRLEDAAASQKQKGLFYFADTGKTPSYDPRGRIYQMQVDKHDPTQATLTLLLSGGQGDDIYNPDNLGTSEHSLVIQEDRNSEFRDAAFSGGYGRVLVYDLDRGTLRPVARVNTPPPLRPGTWESSGVINAEKLLGKDWWLVDVQAHEVLAPQPGPTLVPNSAAGEDGQLLAIKIPNS
jgi:hypothetical protein